MDDWSLLARLRYAFDKSMARGTIALIGWLSLVSFLIIALAATLIVVVGITPAQQAPLSFPEALWQALMRAIDTGNVESDVGWSFRFVMLAVTFAGIFVVSALIGIISTGLTGRLEQLRKGRSMVLERDHTIIFNWSETIFDVINQLVIANESRRRPHIVIMTDRDKAAVEDEIAHKVRHLRNSRIVVRSGDPTDLFDIRIVNPRTCRSVIVLSPDGATDPDAAVIKTILTLVSDPERRPEPYRIAAELHDPQNAEVARAIGGSELQLVQVDDLISRIIVQSTRHPGLSAVYTELLDFEGNEIYASEQPELTGRRFREAQLEFESCTLIGLCDASGRVSLNPAMDRSVEAGDKLLLLAEDDDRIERRAPPEDAGSPFVTPSAAVQARSERMLLIGWNRRVPMITRELSRQVAPGSLLTIAADTLDIDQQVAKLAPPAERLEVELKRIDTTRRSAIEALDPLAYDHVILLGYSDDMSAQAADTHTLITLLHLRAIRDGGGRKIDVVSEINDVRNVALAELTRVDDFVVSNKLVSLMLGQASENQYLEEIFRDLLDDEGARIVLKPASDFVPLGQPINFYEVTRAASVLGQTAIGHHLHGTGFGGSTKGVILNPRKSDAATYGDQDRIIVLAQDC